MGCPLFCDIPIFVKLDLRAFAYVCLAGPAGQYPLLAGRRVSWLGADSGTSGSMPKEDNWPTPPTRGRVLF